MGGCVSRPKELDGYKTISGKKSAEKEVIVKPDKDGGDAPAEEAKAETVTKPENKQEPLVDLSESKPEAEKSDAAGLHPESGMTVHAPETVGSSASKPDVFVEGQATVSEQKAKMVEEKDKEETKERVSA